MLIERVKIVGFKSFRQETSFDLTSGLNVIVGPNGAGKSNIISAIQFALTNEYRKCSISERKTLLYNGKEQRNQDPAFVEITFNNGDRRFPYQALTNFDQEDRQVPLSQMDPYFQPLYKGAPPIKVDSDRVIFKRIFGSKKDRLLVNGSDFPDAHTFLESAGFSSSYFVVKQGKIAVLTTTTNQQRLHFLKEIAGVNSYDSNMKKIQQNLKEAEIIRNEIEARKGEVEERIKVLENQRTELEKVAALDTEKRCIEHVLLKKECADLKQKLSSFNQELHEKMNEYRAQVQPKQERIKALVKEISRLKSFVTLKVSECNRMESEKIAKGVEMEHLTSKDLRHQQELLDLNEEIQIAKSNLQNTGQESLELQSTVDDLTSKLSDIGKEYNKLLASELEANQKYAKVDAKLKSMERNMARASVKGVTSASHLKTLKDEYTVVQTNISKLVETMKEMKTSIGTRTTELAQTEVDFDNCAVVVERLYAELSLVMKEVEKENKVLHTITDQRAALYKEENTSKTLVSTYLDRKLNAKENLRKSMGRALYLGWEGIANIAAEIYGTQSEDKDTGYYGIVLDNFKCDEKLYTAVEVTGGSRLLHFIVKDHNVSRRLLKIFNERKLPGEVHFIPLDSIFVPRNASLPEFTSPNAPIMPLLNSLCHPQIPDPKHDQQSLSPAVKLVFGNTLLCQTFEMAMTAAKRYSMNCVTVEGDKTHRSGPVTGGYINSSTSKIRAYSDLMSLIDKLETNANKVSEVQAKIEKLQNDVKVQTKILEQKETLKNKFQWNIDQEICRKRVLNLRIRELKSGLAQDTKLLNAREVKLTEYKITEHILAKQIKQPSTKPDELNTDALSQIQGLRHQVKALGRAAEISFKKRMDCEHQKLRLQNELDKIYERQSVKLSVNEAEITLEALNSRHENVQNSLEATKEALKVLERDCNLLLEKIPKTEETIRNADERQRNYKDEKVKLMAEISENHPLESNLQHSINATEDKLKVVIKKLESFDTIPSMSSIRSQNMNFLYTRLRKIHKELDKYNALCRLPADVHVSLDEIQEEIRTTQGELDQGFQRIRQVKEFIAAYKQQRLLHFFRMLQRNFRQVFRSLVPEGRANLILHCQGFDVENMDEESGLPEVVEDDMLGVKISASFSTATDSTIVKDMTHLSGGQKSVIAVALILAIQKLDPIPIYLFDEIDSALDTGYREAVAHVIDEMSSRVQFLCTTHRAEFVELAKNHIAVAFINTSSLVQKVAPEAAMKVVRKFESEQLATSRSDTISTDASFDAPIRNEINIFGNTWVHPEDNPRNMNSDNRHQNGSTTTTASSTDCGAPLVEDDFSD